jgi:WS/DGAT/MGAT family acyltransferase
MATHPMSAVDAAWYHMDGPANTATVIGMLITKLPLDFAKVREVYRQRLLSFERFRQRVVERGIAFATPRWEDVPDFDLDQHLHHIALPAPHDRAALSALVDDIASQPLDHTLPLWQVHVVDDVEGGSALIMRYHHCIGDGTAMMAVSQRLYDTEPDTPPDFLAELAPPATRPAASRVLAHGLDALGRSARKALAKASIGQAAPAPSAALDRARLVLAGAGMLVAELLKWPDPKSPLKGDFQPRKHVAWSQPVPISHVKAIGAPTGAKVNDVLVACMTGALRAYLAKRGVAVNHTTVRAMVPVDLRPVERFGELGNEFGLVILDLAVAKARTLDRLAETKLRMDALKRSPEAIAMRLLLDIFGRGPKPLEELANQVFGSKASVVMTNVAGPREPLYLAGTPIDRMMFWVPHPGRQLGMGISIFSYCGQVSLAVIADAHLVPDPETITASFNQEFDRMLKAAATRGAKQPVKRERAGVSATTRKRKPRTGSRHKTATTRAAPRSRTRAARGQRAGKQSR